MALLRYIIYTTQGAYRLATEQAKFFLQPEEGLLDYTKSLLPLFQFLQVRMYALSGDLDAAREIVTGEPIDAAMQPVLSILHGILAGIFHLVEKEFDQAEQALLAAAQQVENWPIVMLGSDPRLLLACLYQQWQRPEDALAALAPVLAECEGADSPFMILKKGQIMIPVLELALARGRSPEFVERILAELRLDDSDQIAPLILPETGETLTAREVEVLQRVLAGATNREIAEHLVISRSTVKNHLHNLYAKLGVPNRTAAAARARELGVSPR